MFEINKRYNFSCHASAILGASYSNVKVISILDYKSALKLRELNSIQRQVYPSLPVGTPSDPRSYTYYVFEIENGIQLVLAYNWIIADSIVTVQSLDMVVKVFNITDSDVETVRGQLRRLGYSIDITILPIT